MNAATSATGMRFAAQNSDIGFCMPRGDDIRAWSKEVVEFKRIAREGFGREIQIWTNASVVQRDSREEAAAYRQRCTVDLLDTGAIDSLMATMCRENGMMPDDPKIPFMRARMSGGSGFPLLGCAEEIASDLELMAQAGIDGVLLTWIDYLGGIERFGNEVIPLMEKKGLRGPHRPKDRDDAVFGLADQAQG
jgi:alkanesulfonate monooxygenase SsuD/methylene tetrahydromethanopterin reductase-like flavin-dependent oxidoreductase (luciferase family)